MHPPTIGSPPRRPKHQQAAIQTRCTTVAKGRGAIGTPCAAEQRRCCGAVNLCQVLSRSWAVTAEVLGRQLTVGQECGSSRVHAGTAA